MSEWSKAMVWTKHDFEREVRRQLVEIASIRKRLPEASDLLPRINLLEASHKNILRKLKEFQDPGRGPPKGVTKSKRPAIVPFDIRSLSREARPRPGACATCPTCGQSLGRTGMISVDVIYHNHAWYHRRCAARTGMN